MYHMAEDAGMSTGLQRDLRYLLNRWVRSGLRRDAWSPA
jgi:hypothetical protein